jgi:hypothetical protein
MPSIDRVADFIVGAEQSQMGRSYDIDNWSRDFEEGFPRFDPISKELRSRWWGQGRENRPRFKELNNESDAQTVEGYRCIEFFPDRDDEESSTFLVGTPDMIMSQACIIMALRRLGMGGGDTGWVGFPIEDWIQVAALTTVSARIILTPDKFGKYNYRKLPYWSVRQVSIPFVDKSKLRYDALRNACGGRSGLEWGEWSARAYLLGPNGDTKHQMVASGKTQKSAYKNLSRFLPFTRATVTNITYNQLDYSKGERKKDVNRQLRQNLEVYPAHLLILNKEAIATELVKLNEKGKPTHTGKHKISKFKFELWPEKEPQGWSARLTEAFKNRRLRSGT